jgi:hypothetical protein
MMRLFLRIAWVNFLGIAGTVVALMPLLDRRRPIGTRRAGAPREAAGPAFPSDPRTRAQTR